MDEWSSIINASPFGWSGGTPGGPYRGAPNPSMFVTPQRYQPIIGGITAPTVQNTSNYTQSPTAVAWTTRGTNAANEAKSLTDFTRQYLASRPTAKSFTDSDTAAIGKFYGSGPGSAQYDLAQIDRQRAAAINAGAASAIRRAARANSVRRMNTGNNSATDRAYAQMLGNIGAQTAMDRTANDASNYRYVADNAKNLTGTRQKLLNDLLMRDFQPLNLANQYEQNNLATLGTLGSLDDSEIRRQTLLNNLLQPA